MLQSSTSGEGQVVFRGTMQNPARSGVYLLSVMMMMMRAAPSKALVDERRVAGGALCAAVGVVRCL